MTDPTRIAGDTGKPPVKEALRIEIQHQADMLCVYARRLESAARCEDVRAAALEFEHDRVTRIFKMLDGYIDQARRDEETP